jgi:2-dehydro-3-deoxyphosphogalactonate aldolase
MVAMPGVLTPTEALDALDAGASGLKFFPADILGPSGIAGIRVVLPKDTLVAAVGGVSAANLEDYMKAGVRAFGIGSTFYRPGDDAMAVRAKARAVIAAYDASCKQLATG